MLFIVFKTIHSKDSTASLLACSISKKVLRFITTQAICVNLSFNSTINSFFLISSGPFKNIKEGLIIINKMIPQGKNIKQSG